MKASFGIRLGAVLIDSVVLFVAAFFLGRLGGLLWFAYEISLLTLSNGQTVGKKVLGIRVTGVSGNWGKSVIRTLMKLVSAFPLGLGYLWMLWDPQSRTWHDHVAETDVVKA